MCTLKTPFLFQADMDDQDEKLANFTAITGSDPVSARGILEVGDNFL